MGYLILGYLVACCKSLRFGYLKGIEVKSSSVLSKRKREEARGKKVRNEQELVDNKNNAHKE
jgi:hypothetical protein